MMTLLQGMPYKPSTEPQDVTETWRKYGWKPISEQEEETDYQHDIERAEYLEDI